MSKDLILYSLRRHYPFQVRRVNSQPFGTPVRIWHKDNAFIIKNKIFLNVLKTGNQRAFCEMRKK